MGVNETVAQQISLQVGVMTETVEVTGVSAAAGLHTELGNVIEEKVIKDVPMQGRNFTQLLMLTPASPGVDGAGSGAERRRLDGDQQLRGNSGSPAVSSPMLRPGTAESLEGLLRRRDHQQQRAFGTYVALPDVDALQEFKVQSHGDKAEFGGVTGGVVNMTLKSGSNCTARRSGSFATTA